MGSRGKPVADAAATDIFRSVRIHLAEVRRQSQMIRQVKSAREQDRATTAFVRALDALVDDLARLEDLGINDKVAAFLARIDER